MLLLLPSFISFACFSDSLLLHVCFLVYETLSSSVKESTCAVASLLGYVRRTKYSVAVRKGLGKLLAPRYTWWEVGSLP